MSKQTGWAKQTQGGNMGLKSLLFLLKITNINILYFVLFFIIPFYVIFARERYLSIVHYFNKMLGYSVIKSHCSAFKNHYLFGQMLLDKFAGFAGKLNKFTITVEGQEIFDAMEDRKKPCILLSSHIGNFEIMGYSLRCEKKSINAIVFGGENATMQKFRFDMFQKNNVNPIVVTDQFSHIFAIDKVFKSNQILMMSADRNMFGNKNLRLPFLGETAEVPTGAYHLAQKYDADILTFFVLKESRFKYKCFIRKVNTDCINGTPKEDEIKQYASSFWSEMENILKQYPHQWFNFYNFWK